MSEHQRPEAAAETDTALTNPVPDQARSADVAAAPQPVAAPERATVAEPVAEPDGAGGADGAGQPEPVSSDAVAAAADPSDARPADADLPAADSPGADLSDADLWDEDPPDAEQSDADLSDADLSDADLSDADLTNADLSDAPPVEESTRAAGDTGAGSSGGRLSAAVAAARGRKISAAGAVIGLLLGLLGFAVVVQVRSNSTDQQFAAARPEDLLGILSNLDARKDRLSQEITQLQNTQQQLTLGSQSRQAALAEASKRADELGILAGSLAAQGPGLRIHFNPATKAVRAADVLDAVEELRGAGAEAMQINGANAGAVRIVAATSFVDTDRGLQVGEQTLSAPYTIIAIGDPPTMQTALNIPGGVVDTVRGNGGNVVVDPPGTVQVTALHPNTTPRYAHPVN
jgi:uncharacterized protein YlxW (UPF0749 family)